MTNPARKIKRTKREQLLALENMNADSINKILAFQQEVGKQLVIFQKEIFAMKNALKRRGLITEFDIEKERRENEDFQKMESQALLLSCKY
jgi:hypothetical protein